MDIGQIITSIAVLLGGGGFFGGIIMLVKLRPEVGQITVTAAQGALIVQTGVIDNLKKEMTRLTDENQNLREQVAAQDKKIDQQEQELEMLRERIKKLEGKEYGYE